MKLMELTTAKPINPILEMIKNSYPLFYNYFETKFKNYELKYPQTIFLEQLLAITQKYSIELETIELATGLNLDNIGSRTTRNNDYQATENHKNKDSYSGFNVEGDFSKIDIDINRENQRQDDSYTLNYFDFLMRTNRVEFNQKWKNIEKEIATLFIIYFGG